jgi:BlaI family penicillinase repressor
VVAHRGTGLSRRERQIMDFLHRHRAATAAEVSEGIADPPSYSSVRAMLRILEIKGHVRHRQVGPRYVYEPTQPRASARRSALRHLMNTFFDGSPHETISALLDLSGEDLDASQLRDLAERIALADREGR